MKISIKLSPDGGRNLPWLVTYYIDRKRVWRYFKTMEEAKAYANEVRHTLRTGANPLDYEEALRLSADTGYTLLELARAGMTYLRLMANGQLQSASPATVPHKAPITDFIQ